MSPERGGAPELGAEGLRRSYRGRVVLDVPSLAVPAGTAFALLGSSGAGKSTLLRILGLLEPPDVGRVLLDGRVASARDAETRMRIAMLFQRPYLFRGTVGDNVAYGLRARKVGEPDLSRRVGAALENVGLAGWEVRDFRELSGGEAQRVALARALVVEPDVLLLDEPLSYIDPLVKERLVREFAGILRERGVTTVWVTHDQEEAFAVADTVGILHEGRFVTCGPLDEVMAMPDTGWTASFLGMEPALRGRIAASAEGMAEVAADGLTLYGPSPLPVGTEVRLAVRPEDVTLFGVDEPVPRSSARNRLDGTVVDVRPKGALVRVVVARGDLRLASLVSRASVSELGIAVGAQVTAMFKASATRVAPLVDGPSGWQDTGTAT